MNFDYTGIDKYAEKRRARLRDLEEVLSEQPAMLAKLQEVHAWAVQVEKAHLLLDNEGRGFIPLSPRCALVNVSATVGYLSSAIGLHNAGISKWIE